MNKVVLCVKNQGYEASLERWKLYPLIGEEHGLFKVIDESGEAYLYPKEFFLLLEVPTHVLKDMERDFLLSNPFATDEGRLRKSSS